MSARRGPPALALRLLRRVLPRQVRDFVEGDLLERHEEYARTSGLRADLWFWRQTLAAALSRFPGPVGVEGTMTLTGLGPDLVRVLRGMVRSPGHSVVAVLTLGLGIGVVGTAFTILNATVLRGLPFEEADRLVHFERARPADGVLSLAVTPHDYLAWAEEQSSFEGLGAYVEASALLPSEGAPPERYLGVRISANSFPLLRVTPSLGRGFTEDDERLGAPDVVVLSHILWQNRFGGAPDIVGREIRLNDAPTTVIGVMPEGFGFPIAERFWLPLRLDLETTQRGQGRLDVFGRLADGVAFEAAVAEFVRICEGLGEVYPDTNLGIVASMRSFHDEYVGEEFTRTAVRMLLGALLVLLVCCANVANLLLIRGTRKQRSLALRVSLGATRGRIVRELLTEAVVLTSAGAVLGVGLAWYGVTWFDRAGAQAGVFALPHGSDSLFWWDLSLDAGTMAVVLAGTCVTALVAGMVPALRSSAAAEGGALTVRSSGGAVGRSGRLSDSLAVLQMGLATSLVLLAGLVTRSGLNVAAADDAIVSDAVFVTTVDVPSTVGAYRDDATRLVLAERLVEHLATRGEVTDAVVTTRLPLALPHSVQFEVADRPRVEGEETGVISTSPGYLAAFGIDLLEGRWFDDRDGAGAEPVAVVNESFAARTVGSGSPVGRRIRLGDASGPEPWVTVVGVVPDLWDRPLQPQREMGVYLPLAQSGIGDTGARLGRLGLRYQTLVTRLRPGTVSASDVVRGAVYEVDGSLPVRELESMEAVVHRQMGRYRVWGRFYTAFALVGLLLAAMGVYGVLSFGVSQRTTEIGVRRALGATGASVQGQVLARAGRHIVIGVVIGLAAGAAMADGLARVLYGVDPGDPLVLFLVPAVMVAVGLAASWFPARRASTVDPMVAIQE